MPLNFYNADRWMKCPSSAGTFIGPAPEPSQLQLEGLAAGRVAELILRGEFTSPIELVDRKIDGYIITPEIAEHVTGYIDLIKSRGHAIVEKDIEWYGIRGRPDAVVINGDTIEVFELKYGWRIVEPEDSWQLKLGALACWQTQLTRVRLWVYQPRPYHPEGPARCVEYEKVNFTPIVHEIMQAAHLARQPNPAAIPGDQCDYCPRRLSCMALQQTNYKNYEVVQNLTHAYDATPADLAKELDFLKLARKLLEVREAACESELTARAKNGQFIPGYVLDEKSTRREISAPPETVRFLTGLDPYKKVLKSPAELEKEGASKDIISKLTDRRYAGHKLEPWSVKTIRRLFK